MRPLVCTGSEVKVKVKQNTTVPPGGRVLLLRQVWRCFRLSSWMTWLDPQSVFTPLVTMENGRPVGMTREFPSGLHMKPSWGESVTLNVIVKGNNSTWNNSIYTSSLLLWRHLLSPVGRWCEVLLAAVVILMWMFLFQNSADSLRVCLSGIAAPVRRHAIQTMFEICDTKTDSFQFKCLLCLEREWVGVFDVGYRAQFWLWCMM